MNVADVRTSKAIFGDSGPNPSGIAPVDAEVIGVVTVFPGVVTFTNRMLTPSFVVIGTSPRTRCHDGLSALDNENVKDYRCGMPPKIGLE